jgi:hypothetical protein
MKKWELTTLYGDIKSGHVPEPSKIWTIKDEKGMTTWDKLTKLANEGWELVSVTPINRKEIEGSSTAFLLYTLKRPIDD